MRQPLARGRSRTILVVASLVVGPTVAGESSTDDSVRRAEESREIVQTDAGTGVVPPDAPVIRRGDGGRAESRRFRPDRLWLSLDALRFEPGSTSIDPSSRWVLDRLVERLRLEPNGYRLEVQGRSPARDDRSADLELTHRRARVVGDYLTRELQIPPDRLRCTAIEGLTLHPKPVNSERLIVMVLRPDVR